MHRGANDGRAPDLRHAALGSPTGTCALQRCTARAVAGAHCTSQHCCRPLPHTDPEVIRLEEEIVPRVPPLVCHAGNKVKVEFANQPGDQFRQLQVRDVSPDAGARPGAKLFSSLPISD